MPATQGDWIGVLQRVIDGDRLALAEAGRLVNGFLVRWGAYDLRDEWEDVVQEVVAAATLALREGRIRDPQAVGGFLKATARFKYMDRLRIQLGLPRGASFPWEEVIENREALAGPAIGAEALEDLRRALARIPDKARAALMAVYVEGLTYDEAARATGTPLGTLKRYLRDGLAQLREELSDFLTGR